MARPPPKAATGLSVKEICDEFGSEPEGHDLRSIRIMERELRTLAAAESTAESLAKIAAHLEPKKGLTWEEAAKTVGWREHTVSPKDADADVTSDAVTNSATASGMILVNPGCRLVAASM